MNIIKNYLNRLLKLMNKRIMKILPGHLAFFLILSLIPSITLIGIICNCFGISTNDVINLFESIIPKGAFETIQPFIKIKQNNYVLFYLLIGFILSSNGAQAIILTSNTLYEFRENNYLKERIKSLFLTILIMFFFIFILIVLAFGNMILKFIFSFNILSNISSNIYNIFIYLKWPVAFFLIYFIIKIIYKLSADFKIDSKTLTKGSLFTTFSTLLVTALYSYYANNIANYDIFYGSLSNIIILMMWIYIVAYIFVIGIAINVNSYMEETVIDNSN